MKIFYVKYFKFLTYNIYSHRLFLMEREKFHDFFSQRLEKFNIHLSSQQEEKFYKYLICLKNWSMKMNLTAIESDEEIILKHFIDSLICSLAIEEEKIERVIDIGTGAGFPGIPLKIYYNIWKLTLLEAEKKKILFLKEIVYNLELKNVEIICDRAENLARDNEYRESFDLVLARGVAKSNIVLEYAIPFVRINKIFLAQTGKRSLENWEKTKGIAELLGAEWERIIKLNFDDFNRVLIVFRKKHPTPDKYPRRPGIPEKRPLNL